MTEWRHAEGQAVPATYAPHTCVGPDRSARAPGCGPRGGPQPGARAGRGATAASALNALHIGQCRRARRRLGWKPNAINFARRFPPPSAGSLRAIRMTSDAISHGGTSAVHSSTRIRGRSRCSPRATSVIPRAFSTLAAASVTAGCLRRTSPDRCRCPRTGSHAPTRRKSRCEQTVRTCHRSCQRGVLRPSLASHNPAGPPSLKGAGAWSVSGQIRTAPGPERLARLTGKLPRRVVMGPVG